MTRQERENYCKDCKRSIYSENPSCDTNIENNGLYVGADDICYNKCNENGMAEKYPWEKQMIDLGNRELEKLVENCIASKKVHGIQMCRLDTNIGALCVDCISNGECEICKRYFQTESEVEE